jgi:hypothetical protein
VIVNIPKNHLQPAVRLDGAGIQPVDAINKEI